MNRVPQGVDQIVLFPTIGLGSIAIIVYFIQCTLKKRKFALEVAVGAILSCSGIVAGSLLMASVIWIEVKEYIQSLDLYVFIGGLAVLVVSLQSLQRGIFGDKIELNGNNAKETE
jgi:cadmium resistance protein CadD (predicted permease)